MIVDDEPSIDRLLRDTQRIAVLGIKPEDHAAEPAFYVPRFLVARGYDVVPVPVYYPGVIEILAQKVHRRLVDVPGDVDMVNVFRRPQDLAPHLEDILATKPKSVWLQLGIRDDAFAEELSANGITVVQDRCLMVEIRRRGLSGRSAPGE
jgi:predicted CoA-binding protein